jgi:hypothetical protein
MKYTQKYSKILNELIKKSFPELKGEYIYIKEKRAPYRAHVSYFPWGFRVIVSKKLRKFSQKLIRRILIHELCHSEIFLGWGVIKTNLDFIYYLISKQHRKAIEREVNILMIKKGYGKYVLESRKENLERGLDYSLTGKEIKSYIKKIRK